MEYGCRQPFVKSPPSPPPPFSFSLFLPFFLASALVAEAFFAIRSPLNSLSSKTIIGRRRHARAPSRIACLHRHGHHVSRSAAEQTFPYKAYVTADELIFAAGRAITTTRPTSSRREPRSRSIATTRRLVRHPPAQRQLLLGLQPASATRRRQPGYRDRRARRGPRGQPHERYPRRDPGPPAQGRSGGSDRSRRNGPAGRKRLTAWCKIAPPAGEFRWVSGRFVDTDYDRDGLLGPRPAGPPMPPAKPPAACQAIAAYSGGPHRRNSKSSSMRSIWSYLPWSSKTRTSGNCTN